MSWAITSAVLTIVGTSVSAYSAREGGKQQQYNLERQAEQETLAAEGQEIERRARLNKVLAANIASASASPLSGEGTPQSIALASARNASSSEGAESLSNRLRQDMLRREGKAAKAAGNYQAASTLLNGAVKSAQLYKSSQAAK